MYDDPIVSFIFYEFFSHILATSTALFKNLSLFSPSPFCNAGLDIFNFEVTSPLQLYRGLRYITDFDEDCRLVYKEILFWIWSICFYTVNLCIPLSWGYTCRIMPSLVDHLNNNNRASFEASELKHNIIIFILSSEEEKGKRKKDEFTQAFHDDTTGQKKIKQKFYLITFLLNTCIYKVSRQNIS